jgi:4-hydroxy-tetrahydrodipicolinate synthase
VGTTGESPTLDHAEHLEVIRATVEYVRGRVPVIAGTGSNSTQEAVDLTQRSHAAGADAMLIVAPYYNKPRAGRRLPPFRRPRRGDRQADHPLLDPRALRYRDQCARDRTPARQVSARPHHQGGGRQRRPRRSDQAGAGRDITVLSGDDSLTLPFMAVGAEGVISVASNLFAREIGQMVKLALANDYAKAAKLHRRLYPVFKALFIEPNPVPIKTALARAGLIASAEVRAPLCEMTTANRVVLEKALAALEK